jgi:hypothetical protein
VSISYTPIQAFDNANSHWFPGGSKAAEDLTARIRRMVGYLRYSPKETGLVYAALVAAALGWLVRSDQTKQVGGVIFGDHWPKITGLTSVALWTLAGVLLILAFNLMWRQVAAPPASTDAAPRPTAIKGPMSFGPHDAELFRRLGRETETSRLLDWIVDDQIGLIVLKGNSGAGKTSLLRAGLPAVLATHPSCGMPTILSSASSTRVTPDASSIRCASG